MRRPGRRSHIRISIKHASQADPGEHHGGTPGRPRRPARERVSVLYRLGWSTCEAGHSPKHHPAEGRVGEGGFCHSAKASKVSLPAATDLWSWRRCSIRAAVATVRSSPARSGADCVITCYSLAVAFVHMPRRHHPTHQRDGPLRRPVHILTPGRQRPASPETSCHHAPLSSPPRGSSAHTLPYELQTIHLAS